MALIALKRFNLSRNCAKNIHRDGERRSEKTCSQSSILTFINKLYYFHYDRRALIACCRLALLLYYGFPRVLSCFAIFDFRWQRTSMDQNGVVTIASWLHIFSDYSYGTKRMDSSRHRQWPCDDDYS